MTRERSLFAHRMLWNVVPNLGHLNYGLGNRRSIRPSYGTAICFQRVSAPRKIAWHPVDINAAVIGHVMQRSPYRLTRFITAWMNSCRQSPMIGNTARYINRTCPRVISNLFVSEDSSHTMTRCLPLIFAGPAVSRSTVREPAPVRPRPPCWDEGYQGRQTQGDAAL